MICLHQAWAFLFLFIHTIIVCVTASFLQFEKKDIFILACTNTCIMSVGPLRSRAETSRQSRFSFRFYSSLIRYTTQSSL